MNVPDPAPQHLWLARLLGEWTWMTEAVPGHDHPVMTGTETFRPIGPLWVQGIGGADGQISQMTLGFDTRTGRFNGTWLGAMMAHLWVYDGQLDASGTRLSLDSTGPSFADDGTLARYRDEIEIVSDNERVLRASYENADGTWTHFMTTRYRRA
ncbi:MAG: DUF1579 domain-containing protein [Myxococcota bacterium]